MRPLSGRDADEMLPITKPVRRTRIVTFDVESKYHDPTDDTASSSRLSQEPGFNRAFLVGFYDHDPDGCNGTAPPPIYMASSQASCLLDRSGRYLAFRNVQKDEAPTLAARLEHLPPEERAIAEGGCVDRFLRHIFGTARTPNTAYSADTTTIYSHNGGRFDCTFVLTWLRRHAAEFDVRVTCVASRAQRISVMRKERSPTHGSRRNSRRKIHRKRPAWVFVDSALILYMMSLADAAETFLPDDPECRKLTEFQLDTIETDNNWEVYNRLDCLVLYKALDKFRDLVESLNGEMGITTPSMAMKLFRRAFQKDPIKRNRHFYRCRMRGTRLCRDPYGACLHTWIRKGYHGGRVEPFWMSLPIGGRDYDENSAYPSMMKRPMPVGDSIEVDPKRFFDTLDSFSRGHVGFVEATVTIPETCSIPPLPYVSKSKARGGKLIFPVGTFSGVWAWEELSTILDPYVGGKILHVHRAVWFQARPVFADFVNTLYRFRQDSKKDPSNHAKAALSEIAKLFVNGYYGKHGMNPDREELVTIAGGVDPMPGDDGSLYPHGGKPIDGDHLTGDVWVTQNVVDAPYMIPQIAAYITALARVALWRACVLAETMGGTARYVDTDAVSVAPPPAVYEPIHAWVRERLGYGGEKNWFDRMMDDTRLDDLPDLPEPLRKPLDAWFEAFEDRLGLGTELGQWSRKKNTWMLAAQYLLPKSYRMRDVAGGRKLDPVKKPKKGEKAERERVIVTLKGVGHRAKTHENFTILRAGGTVHYERVEQHRTVLKEGRHAPRSVPAKKRIMTTYDKRRPVEMIHEGANTMGGATAPWMEER